MRVLIAGGGTGGHLYPGVALAREFERRLSATRVLFVGTARGLETKVIPAEGYDLRLINISGMAGLGMAKKMESILKIPSGLCQSFRLIREFGPNLVIGTGGYVSGPVVLTAWSLGIPRVLVEPNAYPGWTNRALAPFAQRVFTSFRAAERYLRPRGRVRLTGNPVRREIVARPASAEHRVRRTTLLVMGGSQGAHAINRAIVDALGSLQSLIKSLRVIHQTGEKDYGWVKEAYRERGFDANVTPFLDDIPEVYANSDLAVCRAGATTIAELTAKGLPAILVPYPHATHGHQEANADAMKKAGAATVVRQAELSGPVLASHIHAMMTDAIRLHEMGRNSRALGRPDAAERIVDQCLEICGSGERADHVL